MEDLPRALSARFPLLRRLSVQQREAASGAEPLPPFLGILLAVMEAPLEWPLCFVLPRLGELARLTSVLYGMQQFAAAQGELTKKYGDANFKTGDLVRVHPSRHVFRFGGFDPQSPEFIYLRPTNGTERDRWSVRAATFVPRLERTTLTRPIGRMNTPIHDPAPARLDQLLGTSTFGNQGLFRNEVVLLDSSTGFQRFVDSTSLRTGDGGTDPPSLRAVVPFGELARPMLSGTAWLNKWDERNPTGEPLVAVTSSAETLANFCIDAPFRSKLVLVNGLSRLNDLQSFDDIQQTQRLILFADDDDEEIIEALGNRGCRFWDLSTSELTAGEATGHEFDGMFGKLRVWARNKESLRLDAESCENSGLEDACVRLEGLRRVIDDSEDGPVTKLVGRIWRILNDMAAVVRPLRDEERLAVLSRLKEFRGELQANKSWITPDTELALSQSASDLEAVSQTPDLGASKRAALERAVAECLAAGASSVVLVRSENQAIEVDEQFRRQIKTGKLRVCTPRAVKGDTVCDRLICLSWPGGDAMQSLTRSLTAPRITLLGYPFERRWLNQCLQRLERRPRAQRIGADEKTALVGAVGLEGNPWPPDRPTEAGGGPVATDDDVWGFEQRLRAARKGLASVPTDAAETILSRYVSFVGSTYAFLTETHGVVVVTELLSGTGRTKQRLPEHTVDDLKQGDFIVFPESGDRELIQEKADQLIGTDAPKLRKTARLWKEALWATDLTPARFLTQARELGRPRHIMTIRHWFAESSQIGPGTGNEDLSEDLELIALVTDHQPLRTNIGKVIEAIKTLRSAHLSAGMRLRDVLIQRLPDVIGRIEEEGSVVDLGELGSAWVVQVESIAATNEPRGRGEVNRLLWEDRTASFDVAF